MANEKKPQTIKQTTDEDRINLCRGAIIILLGLMFIFFFFGWCYVYNTDYGVEVNCSGWNFICMSFSWNFKSTNAAFGDIAVPFYYYAKYYVIVLEVMTTIIFYLTLVLVALAALNLKKVSRKVTTVFMVVSFIYSVALLAAFITALTMNGSRILPKYCSNNPACSIQSLIIFPFLLSVGILIINLYLRAKLKKQEIEQLED